MHKNEKINNFWKYIKEYIGTKGTIVVPTFTYSATNNEIFDPLHSSSKIGQFSEDFRKLDFTKRNSHSIFSVSSYGYYQNEIMNISLNTCFGKKSIFDFLNEINAKLVCLGCSYNELTFSHYVEECFGVKYRYHKKFNGKYIENNVIKNIEISYFARKLDYNRSTKLNLDKLTKILFSQNLFIDSPFGRVSGYSCFAKDFFKYSFSSLNVDEHFLIN